MDSCSIDKNNPLWDELKHTFGSDYAELAVSLNYNKLPDVKTAKLLLEKSNILERDESFLKNTLERKKNIIEVQNAFLDVIELRANVDQAKTIRKLKEMGNKFISELDKNPNIVSVTQFIGSSDFEKLNDPKLFEHLYILL